MSPSSKRLAGLAAVVFAFGSLGWALRSTKVAPRTWRPVPGACLPCGETYAVIGSQAELERMVASLTSKCREDRSPARWREQVERTGIDFSREALVVLFEV